MTELSSLRRKYESILTLRIAHAQRQDADQKDAIRELASEFPGALRDLDALHLAEIHDRIEAIVAAELDPENMKPWMIAELTFYEALRGALAAKKWLGKNREIDHALRSRFAIEHAADDALAWVNELESIARPPKGRLVTLAIARVANALSVTTDEAKALVFRHPPKRADAATATQRMQPDTGK